MVIRQSGLLATAARLSYFLCAKCSRIIIRINALIFVPFSSASFFSISRCFGGKNVVTLSVLAIGLGDNVPPPLHLHYIIITCTCQYHFRKNFVSVVDMFYTLWYLVEGGELYGESTKYVSNVPLCP